MKRTVPLVLSLVGLTGCVTPNVLPQIKTTDASLAVLIKNTRPALKDQSKKEIRAAEDALIQNGKTVLLLKGDCQPTAQKETALPTLPNDELIGPCRLETSVNLVAKDVPINATQVIALEEGLKAYLLSLTNLANAQSTSAVKSHAGFLIDALGALAKVRPSDSLEKIATEGAENKPRIVGSIGLIVDQYRHRTMVRLVGNADQEIERSSGLLYAFYSERSPELDEASATLNTAYTNLVNARENGSVQKRRQALLEIRTAHARFESLKKKDPATWYRSFRQAHSALNARLKGGGDIDDFSAAINALSAILPAAAK